MKKYVLSLDLKYAVVAKDEEDAWRALEELLIRKNSNGESEFWNNIVIEDIEEVGGEKR